MSGSSRRDVLALAVGGAALAVAGAAAQATPQEAADAIARFTGGVPPVPGKIAIDLPEIAENGNTVPFAATVDSPMTEEDHVSDILVVAQANPRPRIVTFHLTPACGRADVATRIRLAATQDVVVVAKTSKGHFITASKTVKVTVGGCGG
ncbi:MAG TPA: thiosulfate oxidation carrier protein SoxY [Xanthobacteraceae bacterium]|nr:thiosulfate oxidation carrier protein SoxY [Xanthobacteraceae bacterium]